MKDFIKKYHNKKIIWNLWIVAASLVMAVAINFFVIDWSDLWNNLKASVINSKNIEKNNKADIYIETNKSKIQIKNSKEMNNVDNISFSLIYNPENINIIWYQSEYWEVTKLWTANSWLNNFIIKTEGQKIDKSSSVLEIEISKNNENSEQLNIINANFKDIENQRYQLTTSWITY